MSTNDIIIVMIIVLYRSVAYENEEIRKRVIRCC